MKTIRLLILFCIISATAYSQAWVWEKQINTTSNKVTTDPLNNIILLSVNGTATQLTKYTKDGTLIWTKRLSKATAVTAGGSAVADNSGNIYIFTAGFDSVNSVFTGIKIAGITKFNPQGNILWHTNYNVVNSGVNNRLDIKLGDDNNIYTGFLAGSANIGSSIQLGNLSATMTSTNFNLSIGSVTSNGVPRWIRSFPCTFQGGQMSVSSIAVAGNKIFLGGYNAKYIISLDNGLSINEGRCSSYMIAFNQSNGQSIWTRGHHLYVFCLGLVCGCFTPTIDANTTTGRVMLNNNLMGGFVFNGTDTIKSTNDPNVVIYKSYNTIYDTNNVPIKGKTIQTIPDGFSYNEVLLGSRGNSVYATYRDSLRKMDTGYNLIWTKKLVGFDMFSGSITGAAIPPNSNDIILCYTKNSINYLGKLSDSAAIVSGKVYADWDNNGVYTAAADSALSNILVTDNTSPASAISGIDSGKYYMQVVPGTHNLSAYFNHPYYQFLPSSQSATAAQYGDSVSGKDFRLRPLFAFTDVSNTIAALNIARPGHIAYYSVSVKNYGATPQSITVGLKLPALTSYNSITGGTVTVNAPDSITIAMGNVNPFEIKNATLNLNIATTATINDTLKFYPVAFPYVTDTIKLNNRDTLVQPVRTSFDPNEKEVNLVRQPLADTSKPIVYTVHFQNTGTDTAFYVRIADTLSAKLNLRTFNFIGASHPVTTEINNNVISFIFNPIILPDSNHNETQSHGFVKFSIKPAAGFNEADTIYNKAAIYFDYNSAVITNSTKNWYYKPAAPPDTVLLLSFTADTSAGKVILKFTTAKEPGLSQFVIERSADSLNYTAIGNLNAQGTATTGISYLFTDNTPGLVNYYRLKFLYSDGRTGYSTVVVARLLPPTAVILSFTADTSAGKVIIKFTTAKEPGLAQFVIERSTDSLNFSNIGNIIAKGTATTGSSYSFTDNNPGPVNFYRLKLIYTDGRTGYSAVVAVRIPPPPPVAVILSFTAEQSVNTVVLKFATALEPGLSQFVIERSADSISFTSIGTRTAQGSTTSGSNYLFVDNNPAAVNFYRLKLLYADGRTGYSNVVAIRISITPPSTAVEIKVFPSPVSGTLFISLKNIPDPKIFDCIIADVTGKIVWSASINAGTTTTYPINTGILSNGIYFVTLSNINLNFRKKIVVIH